MTEHVHEWAWIYRPDGVGPRYIGCQCGEPMNSDEIMCRVQATERLSANMAKALCRGIHPNFKAAIKALTAYADILEGKDG